VTADRDLGVLRTGDFGPVVVVHGGAEPRRYRNVLEALEAALDHDVDFFEFDVRRTADEVLVVHHDEELGTTRLRELTFAAAEREAANLGYRLPRIADVLQRAAGALRLDVELKEAGYEPDVLRALDDHGYDAGAFVVTSFEPAALDAIHAERPEVVTGLLVWDVSGPESLELYGRSGASFLGPDHAILDEDTLLAADRARIPLLPWTVNDPAAMQRLMQSAAVLGIITDEPARAVDVRGRLRGGRD
jgi:glycerophosphoryl diester phosphodiesterase